jgi:hypothetical protein
VGCARLGCRRGLGENRLGTRRHCVGLPDQVAQRGALAIQMPLGTDGKDRAGRSAALLGEGPERQIAATSISAAIPLRVLAYNLVNLNPTSNPSRCNLIDARQFARRVLNGRQAQPLGLLPIARNIEILGVGADLLGAISP